MRSKHDTNGSLDLFEMTAPPSGRMPVPHYHRDWDETAPHAEPWAGLRPMTADGLPIVGRLRPESNVLVASGHGMLGLTLAPSTAKTVRDLSRDVVSGRPSPVTP